MRPACRANAILAALLAWTAMPAGCLAGGALPAAGSGPSPATEIWLVPGGTSGGTSGGRPAPGQARVPVREARLMAAAAADELDALVAAARGEAPRGGPGAQPAFWSAAGALQRALADLDGALAAGDPACFSILGEARRSLVAVQVACRRARTGRDGVRSAAAGPSSSAAAAETARRMTALTAAVGRLAGAFGRDAVPAGRRGGGLSAARARQLQGMAQAARSWQAALAGLAAAARQQGDAALQGELARLDALLRQVAAEQGLTLAAYLAAVSASNQALALWSANAAYFDPAEQEASQQADAAASDLSTAADTGFVFGADLSGGTAWTYAEGPPAGDAAAASGDAVAAGGGGPVEGGGGPGNGGGGPGDGGGPGEGGGPGDWGGGPGEASGPSGDMDLPPGDAGGDGWTGLPGEAPAGVAGGAAAGAAPVPGAPGAASSAGASEWVVIHGGPDASWQPEPSSPAEAPPSFAMQLGDAPDEALSPDGGAAGGGDDAWPDEGAAGGGGDAGPDDSLPLDWDEICRPWHPDTAPRSLCALPSLLPAVAPGAGDR